jgi:hypothetical protein
MDDGMFVNKCKIKWGRLGDIFSPTCMINHIKRKNSYIYLYHMAHACTAWEDFLV